MPATMAFFALQPSRQPFVLTPAAMPEAGLRRHMDGRRRLDVEPPAHDRSRLVNLGLSGFALSGAAFAVSPDGPQPICSPAGFNSPPFRRSTATMPPKARGITSPGSMAPTGSYPPPLVEEPL